MFAILPKADQVIAERMEYSDRSNESFPKNIVKFTRKHP